MSAHQTLQNADKDAETITYAELDKDGNPIVDKDGNRKTRTLRAAFQMASNLERHVESDKVFHSLYDPNQTCVAAIIGSLHPMPGQKWVPTSDGPHVWVNAFCNSYAKTLVEGTRVDQKIKSEGYQEVSNDVAAVNRWRVLRRGPCINQPSDDQLCKNTIEYAQRYIALYEHQFANDLKQEVRPKRQDVERPDTLEHLYPEAYREGDDVRAKMKRAIQLQINFLKKDPKLTKKQKLKAKQKLKKQLAAQLKSLQIKIPKHAVMPDIEETQKYCAIAWLLTPKYATIDETQFFNTPPIDPKSDPNPTKLFSHKDFDEAMMIQFLRAFPTEKECQEFINNKAKHDLEFAQVVSVKMRVDVPMDEVITKAFHHTIEKGYISKALQQTMVERKKLAKQAAQSAKMNPELVRKVNIQNGKLKVKPSQHEQKAAQAMMAEAKRIRDEKAKEAQEKEKGEKEKEGEDKGGGGSKDDDNDTPPKMKTGPIQSIEVESAMETYKESFTSKDSSHSTQIKEE